MIFLISQMWALLSAENEKSVFRKTGGYAHLATYLDKTRKKYEDSFLIDTGDMFQGSELSVKTTGKAMSPILNIINAFAFWKIS